MSSDNTVAILESKDGYRVEHVQAIENLYWWNTCCDNPNVVEYDNKQLHYEDICLNCGKKNPPAQIRNDVCPTRLKEVFGDCVIIKTKEEALTIAEKIYEDIGYVEYGIQFIKYEGNLNEKI